MYERQVNQMPPVVCVNEQERLLAESVVIGGVYRHYRNKKLYRILCVGRHSETEELQVVYQPLYDAPVYGSSLWIRPLTMFCELVEHEGQLVPRFEQVD